MKNQREPQINIGKMLAKRVFGSEELEKLPEKYKLDATVNYASHLYGEGWHKGYVLQALEKIEGEEIEKEYLEKLEKIDYLDFNRNKFTINPGKLKQSFYRHMGSRFFGEKDDKYILAFLKSRGICFSPEEIRNKVYSEIDKNFFYGIHLLRRANKWFEEKIETDEKLKGKIRDNIHKMGENGKWAEIEFNLPSVHYSTGISLEELEGMAREKIASEVEKEKVDGLPQYFHMRTGIRKSRPESIYLLNEGILDIEEHLLLGDIEKAKQPLKVIDSGKKKIEQGRIYEGLNELEYGRLSAGLNFVGLSEEETEKVADFLEDRLKKSSRDPRLASALDWLSYIDSKNIRRKREEIKKTFIDKIQNMERKRLKERFFMMSILGKPLGVSFEDVLEMGYSRIEKNEILEGLEILYWSAEYMDYSDYGDDKVKKQMRERGLREKAVRAGTEKINAGDEEGIEIFQRLEDGLKIRPDFSGIDRQKLAEACMEGMLAKDKMIFEYSHRKLNYAAGKGAEIDREILNYFKGLRQRKKEKNKKIDEKTKKKFAEHSGLCACCP